MALSRAGGAGMRADSAINTDFATAASRLIVHAESRANCGSFRKDRLLDQGKGPVSTVDPNEHSSFGVHAHSALPESHCNCNRPRND